ncbi:12780_t:CDS:1 [Funneliformis caledonium]|uniref:12780_t:CDS:1 n=1 Tax=Funneliformis caledonium TaxID=1117310 RepID=A0A9N9GA99_9GLOM|nr:12780_t:CDS:1 [Funneliformis caledonium]
MNNSNNSKKGSCKAANLNGKRKSDDAAIQEFIDKLNLENIISPKLPAEELVNRELNKEGTPKKSMNCFICFRQVFYLEVGKQKLLKFAKDGVFITDAATKLWNSKEEIHDHYKRLAEEVKILQSALHKDNNPKKNLVSENFCNYNSDDIVKRINKDKAKIQKRTKNKIREKHTTQKGLSSQSQKIIPTQLQQQILPSQSQPNLQLLGDRYAQMVHQIAPIYHPPDQQQHLMNTDSFSPFVYLDPFPGYFSLFV